MDYDQIAGGYDRRFKNDASCDETGRALIQLAQRMDSPSILEVGCGTGHWLDPLAALSRHAWGMDRSLGMLAQARSKGVRADLIQGDAVTLPFEAGFFDLLFCVNAIHHFSDQGAFIAEAARVIRTGGLAAIVGSDPFNEGDRWYVYDYFEGTWEIDRQRFKRWDVLASWLSDVGFAHLEKRMINRIDACHQGREVFQDPFLRKYNSSQLALLSESAYTQGLEHIEADIQKAERKGEIAMFETELTIFILTGVRAAQAGSS